MKTFKFRLYPSRAQQDKLWQHANLCNRLYNHFLDQRIKTYKSTGKGLTRFEQQKQIVELKKDPSWTELKNVHSQVLQQVAKRLDDTYKAFFKRGFGFPHFRACANYFGLCYPQSGYSLDLQKNLFVTKNYGKIKFKKHRKPLGEIVQIQITTTNNQWFLCITTDTDPKTQDIVNQELAIDLGTHNLVTTSTGQTIKNSTDFRYFDKKISQLQTKRARTKAKSRRNRRLRRNIKKLYVAKNRKTNDFLHKVSRKLSKHDTVFCEDLSAKEMSESEKHGLNRELRNTGLGRFVEFLNYKTPRLIKVDPAYTSQICNACGKTNVLSLKQRTMVCSCGAVEDRDINAAKNIHCLGQAFLGGMVRPENIGSREFLVDVVKTLPYTLDWSNSTVIQEAPAFRQG